MRTLGPEDETERLSALLKSALEWRGELPDPVVHKAASDSMFLHRLVGSRQSPAVVATLVNESQAEARPRPASPELIRRAVAALVKWSRAGFGMADKKTVARRRAACRACPELTGAGDQIVYKLLDDSDEPIVCRLCGCSVDHKARLPTEACPAPAPDDPTLTRWGEPMD